jgi:hypothetical protein
MRCDVITELSKAMQEDMFGQLLRNWQAVAGQGRAYIVRKVNESHAGTHVSTLADIPVRHPNESQVACYHATAPILLPHSWPAADSLSDIHPKIWKLAGLSHNCRDLCRMKAQHPSHGRLRLGSTQRIRSVGCNTDQAVRRTARGIVTTTTCRDCCCYLRGGATVGVAGVQRGEC